MRAKPVQRTLKRIVAFAAVAALMLAAGLALATGPVEQSEAPADALAKRLAEIERRVPPPELGRDMLELQIRHDRLWWAGQAGNWNLAYYMVSELGEALRRIEETNGDAPELQPEKLSEVMPAIMDPAIRGVQAALAKKDGAAFAAAYDRLSGACNACHATAGVSFLHLQRPGTPLLDNLRYAPESP